MHLLWLIPVLLAAYGFFVHWARQRFRPEDEVNTSFAREFIPLASVLILIVFSSTPSIGGVLYREATAQVNADFKEWMLVTYDADIGEETFYDFVYRGSTIEVNGKQTAVRMEPNTDSHSSSEVGVHFSLAFVRAAVSPVTPELHFASSAQPKRVHAS